ncbi:MAG: hypothetical protein K2Q14_02955 [Gammaproteobacteria bacterium]|nr:hypothetical protein [Gammaproteobacteria bacterium]
MPLTAAQKDFIMTLDEKAPQILSHGGQEAILMSLTTKMETIKKIMDASTQEELNAYCEKYEGFYHYMKLLEQLAYGCAEGLFDDIIKK